MKKLVYFVFACCIMPIFAACSFEAAQPTLAEKHLIEPGQVFDNGAYIYFENVEILYDDGEFVIRNDQEKDVIISMMVVGVNSDGSYTMIQMPAFNGVDQNKYEKDMEENGWAVAEPTNRVRAGGTLEAKAYIYDLSPEYPAPDVDKDGYYDIVFVIHPQTSETSITVSTSDPESQIYKISVK